MCFQRYVTVADVPTPFVDEEEEEWVDDSSSDDDDDVIPELLQPYDLLCAASRQATFANCWPYSNDSSLSAANMSRAGFYRVLPELTHDSVSCRYCCLILCSWHVQNLSNGQLRNYDPLMIHAYLNPACPFIQLYPFGTNVCPELIDLT
jgi:hypothetical protein